MNKKIGYFIIIAISLMVFLPLVNAAYANITVEYSNADGTIFKRGDTLGCSATVDTTATTVVVGVDGRNKCFPAEGNAMATNKSAYFSFNTSNYSLCEISSAKFWYYENSVTVYPRVSPYPWDAGYSSDNYYFFLPDRIGTALDLTDYWFGNNQNGSFGISETLGWHSLNVNLEDISSNFTDIELRPNRDMFDELNDSGGRFEINIRSTDYAGVTYDPVLALEYTNCLSSPTVDIISPLEQNYKLHENAISCSYEMPLTWTAIVNSPLQNLTNAWYTLDGGSNVSLIGEPYYISFVQENPNDWDYTDSLGWNVGFEPDKSVDGDYTTVSVPVDDGYGNIFENYTIPPNTLKANLTGYYEILSSCPMFTYCDINYISCNNSEEWVIINNNYYQTLALEYWLNYEIPQECLVDKSVLELKTFVYNNFTFDGSSFLYYESNVTWFNGTYGNTTLYLEEGNHDVSVCVEDTSGFKSCDTHMFSITAMAKNYATALIASFVLAAFFF